MLVQVYNGGSMPAAPNLWYFTHPVLVYGAETEGGSATFSVDTATTIPVIVIRGVPSVGDYLTAYSVGGRWVAELKGSCQVKITVTCGGSPLSGETVSLATGGPTVASGTTNGSGQVTLSIPTPLANPYALTITGTYSYSASVTLTCGHSYSYELCGITCSPCTLPTEDLTLSWTNLLTGDGSTTLVYSSGIWTTGCVDNGVMFQLQCNAGFTELRAIYFTSGECPTGEGNYCSNLRDEGLQLTLASYTCSPLSLTFTCSGVGCPVLFGQGNTQFTVTL